MLQFLFLHRYVTVRVAGLPQLDGKDKAIGLDGSLTVLRGAMVRHEMPSSALRKNKIYFNVEKYFLKATRTFINLLRLFNTVVRSCIEVSTIRIYIDNTYKIAKLLHSLKFNYN